MRWQGRGVEAGLQHGRVIPRQHLGDAGSGVIEVLEEARLGDDDRTFPEHELTDDGCVVQVARGSASVGWNDMATVFRVMLPVTSTRSNTP